MPERTIPAPPSGLHARVALRVARAARRFAAETRVGYAGRWASARRLAELLALGAPAGAELTLRADGPDAEEALAAIAEGLGAGGWGLGAGDSEIGKTVESSGLATSDGVGGRVYRGVGASAGRAHGIAVVQSRESGQWSVVSGQRSALNAETLIPNPQSPAPSPQPPALADWLDACSELLADPAWREALAQGRIGDSALERELAQWLAQSAPPADVGARYIAPPSPIGAPPTQSDESAPSLPHILIASEIIPADLFGQPGLVGAASVRGGMGSHAAIVARALGLPLVVGLPPAALDEIAPGDTVTLDGAAGTVIVA